MSLYPITLISFGFVHLDLDGGELPDADRVQDIRGTVHDVAAGDKIVNINGLDVRIPDDVHRADGADELLAELVEFAEELSADWPRRIAVGCSDGSHHAAAVVELLARQLRARGHVVVVDHMHANPPSVQDQTFFSDPES